MYILLVGDKMFYLILLIIAILYFILWCCIKISSKCEEDYEK